MGASCHSCPFTSPKSCFETRHNSSRLARIRQEIMRFLVASVFFGLAHGGFHQIQEQVEGTNSTGAAPVLRAFSIMVETQIADIQNYGCWCYFDDNWGAGKSQPLNAVDGYCKQLNTETCAINACIIESKFSQNVL